MVHCPLCRRYARNSNPDTSTAMAFLVRFKESARRTISVLETNPMSDLEKNKNTVMEFYDLMFNKCMPAEAIEKYAGDVYIQHNPAVADGKEAFTAYFTRMANE